MDVGGSNPSVPTTFMADVERRDHTAFVFPNLMVRVPNDLLPNIAREAVDQQMTTEDFIRNALERNATAAIKAYLERLEE